MFMQASRESSTYRAAAGRLLRSVVFLAVPALVSCAPGAPPPPPPTVVYVQLVAAADVNAANGQGAPVAVRVYQLASKTGFEGAEFYPLYKSDASALGADLLKKEEVLLAPSATKSLVLMPADPVRAIGVFAAYQSFQTVTWRVDADVPAHQATTVTVTAGPAGLSLATAPGKPPGS